MGKLHKIRRAIKRNPERFIAKYTHYWLGEREDDPLQVRGVAYTKKSGTKTLFTYSVPHRNFVKGVLREMGYNVK